MNLQSFIDSQNIKDIPKSLPLMHTTDVFHFEKIVESNMLKVSFCDVIKVDLLYFYYGRPAYGISKHAKNGSADQYEPICIIAAPTAIESNDIKAIYPFDTGAYKEGKFNKSLHHKMNDKSFEICNDLSMTQKMVGLFFINNKRYLAGKYRTDEHFSNLVRRNSYAKAYLNIIKDENSGPDDRKSTFEIQSKKNLNFTNQNGLDIIAVIASGYVLDDYHDVITKDWSALPIKYSTTLGQPLEQMIGAIKSHAAEYLESEGYL